MRLAAALVAIAATAAAADIQTARIDIDGVKELVKLDGAKLLDGSKGGTSAATWLPDEAKRPCYLVANFSTPIKVWTEVGFTFTPATAGKVLLTLRGPWKKKAGDTKDIELLPVTYDNIRVEGATLVNGSFEEGTPNAEQPIKGWWMGAKDGYPKIVADPGAAKDGAKAVAAWHNGSLSQTIEVKAGTPVTVKAWVWSDLAVAP